MPPSVSFLTSSHLSASDINRCSFPPIISFPQTISPTDAHCDEYRNVVQQKSGTQNPNPIKLYTYVLDAGGVQIHIDKGLRPAVWKLKCQGALEMPNCKFAKISLLQIGSTFSLDRRHIILKDK